VVQRHVRDSYRTVRAWIARIIRVPAGELSPAWRRCSWFGREARNFAEFRVINGRHRDANIDSIFYYAVFYPAIEVVGALATAVIIWWAAPGCWEAR